MDEQGKDGRRLAAAGASLVLRLSVGVLFFAAGMGKFFSEPGAAGVSKGIAAQFTDTWLPSFLVIPYAYVLPYAEVILGALLVVGLFTRTSLFVAGLLFVSLAFGQMVLQSHAVAGTNFNYALIAAVALWFASMDNRISVDYLAARGKKE
jgi:thiosulfate dehydrogenase (quinone) large subunit